MSITDRDLRDIFKLPPKQHHTSAIFLIVMICACLVFLGYNFIYQRDTDDVLESSSRSSVMSENEKLDILNKLSSANPNTMSENDKVTVLRALSSQVKQAATANLNEQEKLDIMKSLKK